MKKRGGGKLTMKDFLPAYCLPKKKDLTPEEESSIIAAQFAEFILPPKQ